MKYTAKQRSDIVVRLKKAKRYLAKGSLEQWQTNQSNYICIAVADFDEDFLVTHLIQERLSGIASVKAWLIQMAKIDLNLLSFRNLQDYRHRWVDELIREFSA